MKFDDIYKKLRQIRIEKGFSQKALGEKCGLTQQAINRIEQGQRKIDLELLIKMSNALEIQLEDFFITNEKGKKIVDLTHLAQDDQIKIMGNAAMKHPIVVEDSISGNRIKLSKDKQREALISHYNKLNTTGRAEAVKRIAELTEIPRYTKPNIPNEYTREQNGYDQERYDMIEKPTSGSD